MRRNRKRLVAVVAVGLSLLVCALPTLAADWERYANPRFGTSAEVPVDGFAPDPAPENGDGQGWTSTDGKGQILVFGAFVLVDETFERLSRLPTEHRAGGWPRRHIFRRREKLVRLFGDERRRHHLREGGAVARLLHADREPHLSEISGEPARALRSDRPAHGEEPARRPSRGVRIAISPAPPASYPLSADSGYRN